MPRRLTDVTTVLSTVLPRRLTVIAAMASVPMVTVAAIGLAAGAQASTAMEVRSAATTSCPASAPVAPYRPGTTSEQIEPLDADRLLLCEYAGFGEGTSLRRDATVTDHAAIAGLRSAINHLTLVEPGQGFHCPAGGGSEIVEIFGSGDREVRLYRSGDGCDLLTSSAKVAWAYGSDANRRAVDLLMAVGREAGTPS